MKSPIGMHIDKNIAIPVRDGTLMRANVYRPDVAGRFPVIMSFGIYGKDIHVADGYQSQWNAMLKLYPDIAKKGSSGEFLRWEMPDPERWVPEGYAVIAVDARGSGQTPGFLDPFSPVETADYKDVIEWAGQQEWSSGKVGLLGVSYLAITQWQVASLQPAHLSAICPWEGCSDLYREWSYHGGLYSNQFPTDWLPRRVLPNQHGNGETLHRDRATGLPTTGPEVLSEEMLLGNRADHVGEFVKHPLDDEWHKLRSPKLHRINVPLLSSGNWGGQGLHLRGNIEGYLRSASTDKWLFIHTGTHFESFYLPRYVDLQKQFFGYYLKGEKNGWTEQSPVQLEIRTPTGATVRAENEWPLARTQWTKYYLDTEALSLSLSVPTHEMAAKYLSTEKGLSFTTAPFPTETEFTGPIAARIFVSSETRDMDMFATLRLFDAANNEVIFTGASEKVPVSRGWLRVSHRKLDDALSTPYRPYHSHNEIWPMEPKKIYPIELEIWPACIVVPTSFRLVLTLQGMDFEFPDIPGRMLHNHPDTRPSDVFDTTHTVVSGPDRLSYLLMPLIPPKA